MFSILLLKWVYQRSVDLKTKLLSRNFPKDKWKNLFLYRLGNTWNLNFDFKFQVFPSHKDRKTNSLICFLGEVMARQFCFNIYLPLFLHVGGKKVVIFRMIFTVMHLYKNMKNLEFCMPKIRSLSIVWISNMVIHN